VGDVPVAGLPVAAHVAVLEGDADPLVGGATGQGIEDLLEARQRFRDWAIAQAPREASDDVGAEEVGVVNALFPRA